MRWNLQPPFLPDSLIIQNRWHIKINTNASSMIIFVLIYGLLHKRILFVRAPLPVFSTLLASCFIWHAVSNRGRNSSACVCGVSRGLAASQVSICVIVGGYTLSFGLPTTGIDWDLILKSLHGFSEELLCGSSQKWALCFVSFVSPVPPNPVTSQSFQCAPQILVRVYLTWNLALSRYKMNVIWT